MNANLKMKHAVQFTNNFGIKQLTTVVGTGYNIFIFQ